MLDSVVYDVHSPKSVDDIVGNNETWSTIHKQIQTNTATHMILVGPAGCGKSLFLRKALIGFPTLIVDCTANFGLRDIRDSIRIFARGSRTADGKLRWIIFEHSDALTADTQAFLRRMLETTSAHTRIVFECKDAGAITEPIISRSSIVSINAPDTTEAIYEVLRRTDNKISRDVAAKIVKHTFGNMRSAIMNALVHIHLPDPLVGNGCDVIESLLSAKPIHGGEGREWIDWAVRVESTCRLNGIDLRDVLRIGWPTSPIVAQMCSQWSRLGGTSPRTLFYNCISVICA